MLVLASPHVKVAMRLEVAQAAPRRAFLAAVEVVTDPHWHVYWKNPGDSGIPTTVEWRVPKGWRVAPLEYPVPRRFAPGGIAAYGYEGRTLFLARITPSNTPGTVSVKVKWLVCAEACIPGSVSLSTRVPIGAVRASSQRATLKSAEAALPRPAKGWTFRAGLGKSGVSLVATLPKGAAIPAGIPTFFPSETGIVDHAQPMVATKVRGGFVVKMRRSPYPESRSRLRGIFVAPPGTQWPGGSRALIVDERLTNEE